MKSLERGVEVELAGDDVLSMTTSLLTQAREQLGVTDLHIERGRQMRSIVQHDVVNRGLSFESAVESLAAYLGIADESVRLAIALANESDR